MNKLLIIVLSLLFLVWCWINTSNINNIETKKENLDLILFNNMITNNKDFFLKWNNDLLFFKVWRAFLFDEYKNDKEIQDLIQCIDWKKSYEELTNSEFSMICKWDNKYYINEDSNYFHMKDILIKYRYIVKWWDFNCDYFIKDNYNYLNDWAWDRLLYIDNIKKIDYLLCKKVQDIDNYDLNKNFNIFNVAVDKRKCSFLKDINLKTLCDEKLKITFEENK